MNALLIYHLLLVAVTAGLFLMASVKSAYGTNNQTITITITSLADGSARQSTVIDNTSNLWLDALVMVKAKSGSSGTAASGFINIYAFATVDSGTTYTESAGASDAAITLTVPPNAILIGRFNVVANATTYNAGPFSVAAAFGGSLPDHWGIIIENKTGHSLDASVGSAWYQGVYSTVA